MSDHAMSDDGHSMFSMPRYRRNVILLATAIGLIPIALIMLAALLAALLGCGLNEAAPQSCSVLSADVAPVLYGLLNLGWLGLVLIPLLMVLVPFWLAVEWGASRVRRRRQRRNIAEQQA